MVEGIELMSKLLGMTAIGAVATAFISNNSGGKFFICETPQNEELTQNAYEGLTWLQVKGIGSVGETGTTQNITNYDTWDQVFEDKDKGIANAGDPEVEVGSIPGDPGQTAFRAMGVATNKNKYAFKIERNDAPIGGQPTTLYNRGVVTGPRNSNGRNEDYNTKIYQLGLVQQEIEVPATPITLGGSVPAGEDGQAFTFTPTISGQTGSVTYQWFGANLAEYGLAINASTGAITGTASKPGTVVGTIVAVDSASARGVLAVSIVIAP